MSNDQQAAALRAALIALVSAAGDTEAGAALCRRLLREAMAVVEELERDPPALTAETHAHALRELAEHLGLASDHAAFLANRATRLTPHLWRC